jgi:hypothetical protein
MGFLKNLRLQFQGELNEIYLVNFSVDPAELEGLLPTPIRLRLVNGRALISMVDVRLLNMKANSWLIPFKFHYQHVAFRVLVEDASWNADHENHGIYFLRSFSDRPNMVWAGNLIANYHLENAELLNFPSGLRLKRGDQFIEYHLVDPVYAPDAHSKKLQEIVGGIDRAWAVEGLELQKTQIVRDKWPLQAMNCSRFKTNFFESAKLEGVFRVPETIHYTWLPAETVQVIADSPLNIQPVLSYA